MAKKKMFVSINMNSWTLLSIQCRISIQWACMPPMHIVNTLNRHGMVEGGKKHASTRTVGIKDRNAFACAMLKHLGAIKTTAFPLYAFLSSSFSSSSLFISTLYFYNLLTLQSFGRLVFRITSQSHTSTLPQHSKITDVPVPGSTCSRLINYQTCRNIPTPNSTYRQSKKSRTGLKKATNISIDMSAGYAQSAFKKMRRALSVSYETPLHGPARIGWAICTFGCKLLFHVSGSSLSEL